MTYYGKRGMALEKLIEVTNESYQAMNLALIEKIPTPWRAYYNKKTKSSNATPMKKSSVDFGGTLKGGTAIYFEAKSTKVKTSFPLANIEEHQLKYLKRVQRLGGISFIIIEFSPQNEQYLVQNDFVLSYWLKQSTGGRKSIPYDDLKRNSILIPTTTVPLDYIKALKSVSSRIA